LLRRTVCRDGGAEALGFRGYAVELADCKAGLSGDRSLRIEKAFGVPMDTLMRMWSAYEIAETRKRERLFGCHLLWGRRAEAPLSCASHLR